MINSGESEVDSTGAKEEPHQTMFPQPRTDSSALTASGTVSPVDDEVEVDDEEMVDEDEIIDFEDHEMPTVAN